MRTDKLVKIIALNAGIAAVNIFVFSPGFLGFKIHSTNTFLAAAGVTMIVISAMILFYGNYRLLTEKEKMVPIKELATPADYIAALEKNYSRKTFSKDITVLLEQIQRLQKKKESITEILLQKFSSTEMSYQKFAGVIKDAENLLYINIKSILNKLNAFDEEEYLRIKKAAQSAAPQGLMQTKLNIYNEYISFVKGAEEDNEYILLKLDELLLEISKFDSLEEGEIENMGIMQELDDLISKTKYYK